MYILIKNQEGESMNLLSQNTDFNALLTAMKTDIEAEYEKATGYAIDLTVYPAHKIYGFWQCVCDHRRFCESAQGNSFRAVFH